GEWRRSHGICRTRKRVSSVWVRARDKVVFRHQLQCSFHPAERRIVGPVFNGIALLRSQVRHGILKVSKLGLVLGGVNIRRLRYFELFGRREEYCCPRATVLIEGYKIVMLVI